LVTEFCEGRLSENAGDVIIANGSNIAKVIQTNPFILEILDG